MSLAVGFRASPRSGYRSRYCPDFASKRSRALVASRGRVSAEIMTAPSSGLSGRGRSRPASGRAPGGLDVSGVGRVKEVPQDLRFTDQGGHAARLPLVARRVPHHEVDGFLGVPAGAGHPRAEILQHVLAHPRVVTLPGQHSLRHEVRGEELGEGGSHRLQQGPLSDQLDVAVTGKAYPGKDGSTASDLLAIEPDPGGQPQPQFQATFTRGVAVVIWDAVNPHAAKRRVLGLGKNDRVFDRDARLVVVAIEDPLLS